MWYWEVEISLGKRLGLSKTNFGGVLNISNKWKKLTFLAFKDSWKRRNSSSSHCFLPQADDFDVFMYLFILQKNWGFLNVPTSCLGNTKLPNQGEVFIKRKGENPLTKRQFYGNLDSFLQRLRVWSLLFETTNPTLNKSCLTVNKILLNTNLTLNVKFVNGN